MGDLDWKFWAFIGGIFVVMGTLLILVGKENHEFMQECMADGKKQYECKAMNRPNVIYMVR